MGTTGVSEATRDAIRKKALELEYTPTRMAVALKSGRRGTIGVFLHFAGTPGSEVSDRLLRGLAEGLKDSGLQMWLRFFSDEEEFLNSCNDHLKGKVDGLIVAGVRHAELIAKLQVINAQGLPVVSVFSDLPESLRKQIVNVGVDWKEQGRLGTSHLIDQGCQKLATFRSTASRFDGFVAAHEANGLTVDPSRVIDDVDYSVEGGRRAITTLLERGVDFDGIVCECDAQAVGAVNEMTRRGINAAKRAKIVGVDNSPLASACLVPLSSVTPEMTLSGVNAVDLLLRKIEGEAVESMTLRPRIIVRASSTAS